MKRLGIVLMFMLLSACTGPLDSSPDVMATQGTKELGPCAVIIRDECHTTSQPNASPRRIAIASDLQPWRTEGGGDPNSSKSAKRWTHFVLPVVSDMAGRYNQDSRVEFAMFNGDMTDFGWAEQREYAYSAALHRLKNDGVVPYYGLGNHDIANNVGDCWDGGVMSSDACAYNTSNWLRGSIQGTPTPGSNDFQHDAVGSEHGWAASNAYSFRWNNLRFIQLNFHPDYEVHLGHSGGTNNVAWRSAVPFLRGQLEQARQRGEPVILNWHAADTPSPDLLTVLKEYRSTIAALFTGHIHEWAFEESFADTGIPHWTSDAMFKGSYYSLEVFNRENRPLASHLDLQINVVKVNVQPTVTDGHSINRTRLNTILYQDGMRYLCTEPSGKSSHASTDGAPDGCKALPM